MSDMAMKYEDWLRGCVHHDGRKGNVYLPCDTVLEIADWIEAHRDVAPVRHGMWVDVDRMQMHDLHGVLTWGNSFMCTEYNFKTFAVEGHMSQYHYCPCCGARMDGDDNEID